MNPIIIKEIVENVMTPICGKRVTKTLPYRCSLYNPTECNWRCRKDDVNPTLDWGTYLTEDEMDMMQHLDSVKRIRELNVNMDKEEGNDDD